MGKYLMLWELNESKMVDKPKEIAAGTKYLMEMVKQDIRKGLTKDWGVFVGETNGYTVVEGTEQEVMNSVMQFNPFVRFKVRPIASVGHVEEMIQAMTK